MQASRIHNRRHQITGILLYNGFTFVQTIEGPREACRDLFSRIEADARHSEVRAFGLQPIEVRRFPDWSMRLLWREELRTLVPELDLLDLKDQADVERLHRRIAIGLATLAAPAPQDRRA